MLRHTGMSQLCLVLLVRTLSTKLVDLGEQRIWLAAGGGFVATRTDHQRVNAQDGFLDCVEKETTSLQRWRPR